MSKKKLEETPPLTAEEMEGSADNFSIAQVENEAAGIEPLPDVPTPPPDESGAIIIDDATKAKIQSAKNLSFPFQAKWSVPYWTFVAVAWIETRLGETDVPSRCNVFRLRAERGARPTADGWAWFATVRFAYDHFGMRLHKAGIGMDSAPEDCALTVAAMLEKDEAYSAELLKTKDFLQLKSIGG